MAIKQYNNKILAANNRIFGRSNNPIVQRYLNKLNRLGYTLPSQSKIDIYNTAWDYADSVGITPELDLFGLFKTENYDQIKVPFVHSGRQMFTPQYSPVWTANTGVKSDGVYAFINSNWSPARDGIKFQVDDACKGVILSSSASTGGGTPEGVYQASGYLDYIYPNLGGYTYNFLQGLFVSYGFPGPGLFHSKINSGTMSSYWQGVFQASDTGTPLALINAYVYILAIGRYSGSIISTEQQYYSEDVQVVYRGSSSIDPADMKTFTDLLLL